MGILTHSRGVGKGPSGILIKGEGGILSEGELTGM
jgi:hypothetical protein